MDNSEEYLSRIVKLLNDPSNESLREEVERLRALSPDHEAFYREVFRIWQVSSELRAFESINTEKATAWLSAELTSRHRTLRPGVPSSPSAAWKWVRRVAAAVFIGMLGYGIYIYSGGEDYLVKATAPNVKDSVILADGTRIFLDGNTVLKYPGELNGRRRKVYLEKGKAFFAVARDEAHPFVVQLGQSAVTVLGTSFNIYSGASEIQVSVKTGAVRFDPAGGKEAAVVPAGKGVVYNISEGSLQSVDVANKNADAWLTHRLSFTDASLAEVLTSLEDYYNVKIVVKDSIVDFQKFNATFKDNELREVLEVLAATYPINIGNENEHIVIESSQ